MKPEPGFNGVSVRRILERVLISGVDAGSPLISEPVLRRIQLFAATLEMWGRRTNLTAEPTNAELVAFHILDSLAPLWAGSEGTSNIATLFRPSARVADLGSGAGFPGLILAASTGAAFTLIERRRKRAGFLAAAVLAMSLTNVSIATRAEATELADRFDLVLGRAFAKPSIFYQAASGMLAQDGIALLYANPDQELEADAASAVGLNPWQRISYQIPRGLESVRRTLVLLRKRL